MIVWLASYPRSGNTFFRVLLNSVFNIKTLSIYNDTKDIGADKKTAEVVGHEFLPNDFDIKKARADSDTHFIKTHELYDSRVTDEDKVIYLIRDGRDSMVSFIHYLDDFFSKKATRLDAIIGRLHYGSWGKHVESWLEIKPENLLLVKFEELTNAPHQQIAAIAKFINAKPIATNIPTFSELKAVNSTFFRSGKQNSWEQELTEEEHLLFWLINAKQLKKFGYCYKKPALFSLSEATAGE